MDIEIHDAEAQDFDMGEVDAEKSIEQMKDKAVIKKGRGFNDVSRNARDGVGPGEHIDDGSASAKLQPQRSVEGWIIFITNLHEETTEENIMDAFQEHGTIKNIHLNQDRRTGFIKGYCLLEYDTYDQAEKTIQQMNGTDLLGSIINVTWGFVKPHRK